jgi:hypothetical protein
MMPDLFDLARNLYDTGRGSVPASAWTATVATLLWMYAWRDALSAGGRAAGHGGDDPNEEAFRDTLADRLGWSKETFDRFWTDSRYDFAARARRAPGEDDAWERMTRNRH